MFLRCTDRFAYLTLATLGPVGEVGEDYHLKLLSQDEKRRVGRDLEKDQIHLHSLCIPPHMVLWYIHPSHMPQCTIQDSRRRNGGIIT